MIINDKKIIINRIMNEQEIRNFLEVLRNNGIGVYQVQYIEMENETIITLAENLPSSIQEIWKNKLNNLDKTEKFRDRKCSFTDSSNVDKLEIEITEKGIYIIIEGCRSKTTYFLENGEIVKRKKGKVLIKTSIKYEYEINSNDNGFCY